jgi:hypothetical protein
LVIKLATMSGVWMKVVVNITQLDMLGTEVDAHVNVV